MSAVSGVFLWCLPIPALGVHWVNVAAWLVLEGVSLREGKAVLVQALTLLDLGVGVLSDQALVVLAPILSVRPFAAGNASDVFSSLSTSLSSRQGLSGLVFCNGVLRLCHC